MDTVRGFYLRITPALHKALRQAAAEEERTMNQVAVSALRAYLKMPKGSAPAKRRRKVTS